MTSLKPPPPPESASIAFARAWRISPVGLAGMLAVGGLSMMVAGFAPIHATASGFSQSQVSVLMVSMQLGTILVQLPFGWISDRTDRRYVLVAASLLVVAGGVTASLTIGAPFAVLVAIFMVWGGATESIYSISSAHANDRAGKADLVALSSTMLFAWSLSGFLIPGMATALTAIFGTQAFMYVAVAIAAAFCVFVLWRLASSPAAHAEGSFAPMSAQAPLPADLAFSPDGDGER
jgi:MFS family permease